MSSKTPLSIKILAGSFTAIIFTLVGSIFAYLIRVIYSRTLTIEDYGLFYAVFGLFSILSTYADLGFGEAIAYFIPKHFKKKNFSDLWNTFLYGQIVQIGVSLLLGITLVLLAPYLARNYFKVEGSESLIYIFCAFLVLNGFLNGINQIFTGLQKPNYFSTINTIKTFFILFLSLIAVFLNKNTINVYGLIWLVSYFITVLFYLFMLLSKHPFLTENKLVKSRRFLESLIKYAIPAFITTFIYSLMTASDIFFLTLYRGVSEVGVYNIIVPLASIGIIFLAPIHNILLPLTSSLMEGERDKLSVILTKLYKFIPFAGVYFGLFILLFPDSLIKFIFGEKWLVSAVIPLSILSVGYIFLLLSNLLGTIALGLGQIQERLKILFTVGIVNIILDAYFIYRFGLIGSVIMDSVIALALVLIFTNMIAKYIKFEISVVFYTELLAVSIVVFIFTAGVKIYPSNIFELIMFGIIYTIFFAFIGFALKIFDRDFLIVLNKNHK